MAVQLPPPTPTWCPSRWPAKPGSQVTTRSPIVTAQPEGFREQIQDDERDFDNYEPTHGQRCLFRDFTNQATFLSLTLMDPWGIESCSCTEPTDIWLVLSMVLAEEARAQAG